MNKIAFIFLVQSASKIHSMHFLNLKFVISWLWKTGFGILEKQEKDKGNRNS